MKKPPRKPPILVTNRIFALALVAFCAAGLYYSPYFALIETTVAIAVFVMYYASRVYRRRRLTAKLESALPPGTGIPALTMLSTQLPVCLLRMEDGELLWGNRAFFTVFGRGEPRFETPFTQILPEFSLKWLREGRQEAPDAVSIGSRKFAVSGTVARSEEHYMVAVIYWTDITELVNLRLRLEQERPCVALIALDNYDELLTSLTDAAKSVLLATVDDKLAKYAESVSGVLRKYERDRHILIIERRELDDQIKKRFAQLEQMKTLTGSSGVPATLSIGVGCDGDTPAESMKFAYQALELALSRGGDQVAVKNKQRFEFYGGQSREVEKRTKVKSRVMSGAIKEMVLASSKVFVMSHNHSDIDSIGSASGIVALARQLKRPAHIAVNMKETAARSLIDRLSQVKEYANVFVTPQWALNNLAHDTLLVITDTSRPEMVESPELLERAHRVALIDHHRRAASYINAALTFHEPYASSASELVCEILQYAASPGGIKREEAEGILGGIVMDTHNFQMHTGVRTFEAAAWLRSMGADTISVKRLFQTDLDSNLKRYRLISSAEMINDQVALAAGESAIDRVTAAKAADELLSVSGVQASFVVVQEAPGKIAVSARSLGDINVQVIAEKMGGGGHQTSAGTQMSGVTVEEAKNRIIKAVEDYFTERGNV